MRSQSNDVRPDQEFSLVLSERMFIELATATNKQTDAPTGSYFNKLVRFVQSADTPIPILIAKDCGNIEDSERARPSPTPGPENSIDWKLTNRLIPYRSGKAELPQWTAEIADVIRSRDMKSHQLASIRANAAELQHWRPDFFRRVQTEEGKLGRTKHLADISKNLILPKLTSKDTYLSSPEWMRTLTINPLSSAVVRWQLVHWWYTLELVAKPGLSDKTLGNNYDDAFYVFLALYSGHLATKDKRQQDCVNSIALGEVQIYDSLLSPVCNGF